MVNIVDWHLIITYTLPVGGIYLGWSGISAMTPSAPSGLGSLKAQAIICSILAVKL